MDHEIWVSGQNVVAGEVLDGQSPFLDVVTADSAPFSDLGRGQAVPNTARSGLVRANGRMFTLRGSAVVLFHVTIPVHMQFPRPGPLSITAPQGRSFILKRIFFKYYCFPFNRIVSAMTRVSSVAAFDAGETRGPLGALRRNTDPGRTRGFQLEAGGATHPNVVPSLNSVDQLQRRVNFLNVEEDPALVGPVNLEITVVRRSEQMIYGSICFVAFGIQYETR